MGPAARSDLAGKAVKSGAASTAASSVSAVCSKELPSAPRQEPREPWGGHRLSGRARGYFRERQPEEASEPTPARRRVQLPKPGASPECAGAGSRGRK